MQLHALLIALLQKRVLQLHGSSSAKTSSLKHNCCTCLRQHAILAAVRALTLSLRSRQVSADSALLACAPGMIRGASSCPTWDSDLPCYRVWLYTSHR